MCSDVVSRIGLVALVAQMAASVALNGVAPGARAIVGALANQIDFGKLGSGIKNLIVTERDSRMPLPEYKFGGSLVLLCSKESHNQMMFVQLLGDGRVLENMFCVQGKDATSSGLPNGLDVHQLKTFCQVINDLDNSALTQAITSFASAAQQNFDRTPREFSQLTLDHSIERVKDGAGRFVKSTTSGAKSIATNATR